MPYIKPEERELALITPQSLGQLNFAITKMCMAFIDRQGGISYDKIAQITGVLENVKQEFYRRVATPYEDRKILENGDVY